MFHVGIGFGIGGSEAISNDDHKLALERITAKLRSKQMLELRELAKGLELPFETVLNFYHHEIYKLDTERRSATMRSADAELEIRSTSKDRRPVKINPGEIYEVITRPQYMAFRPKRLEILQGDDALWTIKSFKIGNREQLRTGEVTGNVFNDLVKDGHIEIETVQTAMDVVLIVQLSYSAPEPIAFEAKFHGTAAY